MTEEESIPFVKFKRENKVYSSLGHYRSENSSPRPTDLGVDLIRSSIFPKKKGALTRNIRLTRSLQNLQKEKDLNYSLCLLEEIPAGLHAVGESYASFIHVPGNITKQHLLLNAKIFKSKIFHVRRCKPSAYLDKGRHENALLSSLISTHDNKSYEPINEPYASLQFLSQKETINFYLHQKQPLVFKITFSTSSQIKDKILGVYNRYPKLEKKDVPKNIYSKESPELFCNLKVFSSINISHKIDILANVPNTLNTLPLSDEEYLKNIFPKETETVYKSSRQVYFPGNKISIPKKMILPMSIDIIKNCCVIEKDARSKIKVIKNYPIQLFQIPKYPKRNSYEIRFSKDEFKKNDMLSKLFCLNSKTCWKFCDQRDYSVTFDCFLNDIQVISDIFGIENTLYAPTFEKKLIPSKSLKSIADFDMLSLLENVLDDTTFKSALTQFQGSREVFILFKKYSRGSDISVYNVALKIKDLYKEVCNNSFSLRDSRIKLNAPCSSSFLHRIYCLTHGYKTADTAQIVNEETGYEEPIWKMLSNAVHESPTEQICLITSRMMDGELVRWFEMFAEPQRGKKCRLLFIVVSTKWFVTCWRIACQCDKENVF